MGKIFRQVLTGTALFLVVVTGILGSQNATPAPANPPQSTAAPAPDLSRAYYHFMLARRFRELAGLWNRSDLVERAISEYKQAIEAHPPPLFLRPHLPQLYWPSPPLRTSLR